jgi:hypothetical protein
MNKIIIIFRLLFDKAINLNPSTDILSVFNKLERVINSCINYEQLLVATKMIDNFNNLFENDSLTQLLTTNLNKKRVELL